MFFMFANTGRLAASSLHSRRPPSFFALSRISASVVDITCRNELSVVVILFPWLLDVFIPICWMLDMLGNFTEGLFQSAMNTFYRTFIVSWLESMQFISII
jgi:hypothetical protein